MIGNESPRNGWNVFQSHYRLVVVVSAGWAFAVVPAQSAGPAAINVRAPKIGSFTASPVSINGRSTLTSRTTGRVLANRRPTYQHDGIEIGHTHC
jgi:hypothetical protein